jgi:serine/threonine protein kinase
MNKELSANTTLSHYRIVSKIGAGGMGEVYLAQDTKLDRKVALKILPADVASSRDRMERLGREAKSAAARGFRLRSFVVRDHRPSSVGKSSRNT